MMTFIKVIRSRKRYDDGSLPAEVWRERGGSPTLNAFDNNSESRATVIAFGHTNGLDLQASEKVFPTLRVGGGEASVVAPTITSSNDPSRSPQSSEITQQVAAVLEASAQVRRLTPRECERLQGFPDDWTAGQADSNRYKQMGNAVTVNVAHYIASLIDDADEG